MKLLAVAVILLAPLRAFSADLTDSILNKYKEAGLSEVQTAYLKGARIRLHLTASAKTIIDTKQFDVADDKFDQVAFNYFIIERFAESLDYFSKIVSASPFEEFHAIVNDLGEARKGTISQAKVSSRVIELDVRRWHKLYRGKSAYLADVTSIHEYAHTNNYFLDEREDKKHRELVAIVFESLNLIRLYGPKTYKKNYLKKVSIPVARPDDVLGDRYNGMPALRAIAHSFISKVYDGVYAVEGDPTQALERFAFAYLSDTLVGSAGFDSALNKIGFRQAQPAPLKLELIQYDLHRELSGGTLKTP